jgi:hypothetical protein
VTGVKLEYELPWPFNLEASINYQWERIGLAEGDAARFAILGLSWAFDND